MARWTKSQIEVEHIVAISQQIPIGGIAMFVLSDDTSMEGVIRRINQGNNAGQDGWKYYGEVEIETLKGQRFVIDYLDLKSARDMTKQRSAAYAALRL